MKKVATNKLSQDEVLRRFNERHGEAYDYSKVHYTHSKTKICVVCPTHGEFWTYVHNHWGGHGCVRCGQLKRAASGDWSGVGRPKFKMVDGKKECKKCNQWMELDKFHKIPSSGQILSMCKECHKAYCRAHRSQTS